MGSSASSTTKVKPFHYQEPGNSKKESVKKKANKVIVQPKPRTNPELIVDKEPVTSDEFKRLRKRLTTPGPCPRYRTTRFNSLQVTLPGQIANDNNNNKDIFEHDHSTNDMDPDWRDEIKMILPDQAVRRIHQIRIYPQSSKNSPLLAHTTASTAPPYLNNNKVSKQQNMANSQHLLNKSSSKSSNDFILEDIEDCGVTIGSCRNMQSAKGGLKYDVALYGRTCNKSGPKPVLNTSSTMGQDSQSSMKTKLKKKLWAAEVRRKQHQDGIKRKAKFFYSNRF